MLRLTLLTALASTDDAVRRHGGGGGMHRRLHCASWSAGGNGTSDDCSGVQRVPASRRTAMATTSLGYAEMCRPSAAAGPCQHKRLLPNLTPLYALAGLAFLVPGALAMSAGIGGGGIFVPVLALLVRFPPHVATALSQACSPACCGRCCRCCARDAREARHSRDPSRACRPSRGRASSLAARSRHNGYDGSTCYNGYSRSTRGRASSLAARSAPC